MSEMGKAMMGTGEASGEDRAIKAAEAAISNPLLAHGSMRGARGVLINITGGDLTLFEVDTAANRIREEVGDSEANIIFGSTFNPDLEGIMRVSVVATGIDADPSLINTKTQNTVENILTASSIDIEVKEAAKQASTRASMPLALVHTDLCGPMSETSFSGASYMLVVVDDFSRYTWVYFLKLKSEALSLIQSWKAMVEQEQDSNVKPVNSSTKNSHNGERASNTN